MVRKHKYIYIHEMIICLNRYNTSAKIKKQLHLEGIFSTTKGFLNKFTHAIQD